MPKGGLAVTYCVTFSEKSDLPRHKFGQAPPFECVCREGGLASYESYGRRTWLSDGNDRKLPVLQSSAGRKRYLQPCNTKPPEMAERMSLNGIFVRKILIKFKECPVFCDEVIKGCFLTPTKQGILCLWSIIFRLLINNRTKRKKQETAVRMGKDGKSRKQTVNILCYSVFIRN